MNMTSQRFLSIENRYHDYRKARFVVVPVPYEKTTTYVKGTKHGPAAILNASQQIELFDEELGREPCGKEDIFTSPWVSIHKLTPCLSVILKDGKIPAILGGEHSLTPVAVKTVAQHYKNLSVLQFDSHADLDDIYRGSKENHACALRRVLEICPAVQVGVRNISREGWEFAQKSGQIDKIHWARKLELVEKIEGQLSKDVYITIDVDVFDPSVIPATGTPEPGGMLWYEVLDILIRICRDKNVVGFDVVELSPQKGFHASDFAIAKLVYKIMSYISAKG